MPLEQAVWSCLRKMEGGECCFTSLAARDAICPKVAPANPVRSLDPQGASRIRGYTHEWVLTLIKHRVFERFSADGPAHTVRSRRGFRNSF